MECSEQRWLSTDEYLEQFIIMARGHRVPLAGSIAVTHRCNLKCVHCYLGPRSERQNSSTREMGTGKLCALISEIADAGCLYLLITGGEPLLRDDFPEIYRYAKETGLLITVFSNGTLLTEKILALFREFPPHEVEITLYGATAQTYEKISGIPSSYEKCLRGIKSLVDHGIKVNLKTILMTLNMHELFDMEKIAKQFGTRFRFDAAISPCFGGDKTPLAFRVPPEEAIRMEFSDNTRIQHWKNFFESSKQHMLVDDLYGCGAGVTGFHIDPFGNLQPCMMILDVRYDLFQSSFHVGWNDMIHKMRNKKAGTEFICRGCEKINLCGYCPAFFRLENGAEDMHSEYVCTLGHLRYQRIKDNHLQGVEYDA